MQLQTCDSTSSLKWDGSTVVLETTEVEFHLSLSDFFMGISSEVTPYQFQENLGMYSDVRSVGDICMIAIYDMTEAQNGVDELWFFDTDKLFGMLKEMSPSHYGLLKCLI